MFGLRKKREYFPEITEEIFREEAHLWLEDFDLNHAAAGVAGRKHTIVQDRKKPRPRLAEFQEVTVHSNELEPSDRLFVLEQARLGILKLSKESTSLGLGQNPPSWYGDLAGRLKDVVDHKFGPEWQCIVGKKDAFGSCLCPRSGHYLNFNVGEIGILIFKAI